MRDIGLFTRTAVPRDFFESLLLRNGGRLPEANAPDVALQQVPLHLGNNTLYVNFDTRPEMQAYFNDEERVELEAELGFPPASYVAVHFTWGRSAFESAMKFLETIRAVCGGVINFEGAGGGIGKSPSFDT